MIIALWARWRQDGRWRWLALVLAVLVLDAFVGSTLLSWEIRQLKEAW